MSALLTQTEEEARRPLTPAEILAGLRPPGRLKRYKRPPQQNLWADSGSGSRPNV